MGVTDEQGVWRFCRKICFQDACWGDEKGAIRADVRVSCLDSLVHWVVRGQVKGTVFYFGHVQLAVPRRNPREGIQWLVCPASKCFQLQTCRRLPRTSAWPAEGFSSGAPWCHRANRRRGAAVVLGPRDPHPAPPRPRSRPRRESTHSTAPRASHGRTPRRTPHARGRLRAGDGALPGLPRPGCVRALPAGVPQSRRAGGPEGRLSLAKARPAALTAWRSGRRASCLSSRRTWGAPRGNEAF